jgi:hypothetical protein
VLVARPERYLPAVAGERARNRRADASRAAEDEGAARYQPTASPTLI